MKKKFFAVALATTMVAGSTLGTFAANVDESKVYEGGLVIDGTASWNSGGGDQYLISDTPVVVKFTNEPFIDAKPDAVTDENWDNFVLETLASDSVKGVTMRADANSWTYGDATIEPTCTVEKSWDEDWAAFKTICKENTDITLTATKKDAKTVTFVIEFGAAATETYTIAYPDSVPSDLRFQVGADGARITVNSVTYDKKSSGDATKPSGDETKPSGDETKPSGDETKNPSPDTKPGEELTTKNPSPDTSKPGENPTKKPSKNPPITNGSADTDNSKADINYSDVTAKDLDVAPVVVGLEEGLTLKMDFVSGEYKSIASKYVKEKLAGKKVVAAELYLLENNKNTDKQPNGNVKVTLPLFEKLAGAKWIQVYRYDEKAKDFIAVDKPVEVKDNKFTFETNHFTPYLFASVDAPEPETTTVPETTTTGKTVTDTNKKPNTGDSAPIAVFAGMAAAGLAVFAVSKKRKNA